MEENSKEEQDKELTQWCSNSYILEEVGQKDRERGKEKREEELGVINQLTYPDSRQSAADIKVLSCQSCFTDYCTEEKRGGGGENLRDEEKTTVRLTKSLKTASPASS